MADGKGKFPDMAEGGKLVPPLFVWTVAQSHDDLPGGFQRAVDVYQARASYRMDMFLYSILPCSVLALGLVVLTQTVPVIGLFITFLNWIGNGWN